MVQEKPFNPAIAGTTKYMCLKNVRLGYGIPAHYSTAKKAWDGSKKHPDRNFPAGCSVPVFWSLWLTLDGVYADYGHVGVRLPDGRIWTDGRYCSSVDALNTGYLGGKGIYLGWSEDLNNVTVIKESAMLATKADLDQIYQSVLRRPRSPGEGENVYLNKDLGWVFKDVSNSQEKAVMEARETAEDKERESLKKQVAEIARQIDQTNQTVIQQLALINEIGRASCRERV